MSEDELKVSILNLNRRIARLERTLDVVAVLAAVGTGLWLLGWM